MDTSRIDQERPHLPDAPNDVAGPGAAGALFATELTALRRHVAFFDRIGDGRVTIGEVVEKLRLLGCSEAYARVNAIGGMLARTTEPGLLAHDAMVVNAHRGVYRQPDLSGETRIFDPSGRFDAARFDEVLARYGAPDLDGLRESDIARLIADISLPGSVGRSSSELAFRLLMTIAGEPGPGGELVLTRSRLRAFYEGDLLPELLAARTGTAAPISGESSDADGAQPTGTSNAEPVFSTFAGVVLGAARVACPFATSKSDGNAAHQRS